MKNLVILLFALFYTFKGSAQTNIAKDTTLKFDHYIMACEKQWVVMYKPDTAQYYTFGYVYIDGNEGGIFQKTGSFKIGKNNNYMLNGSDLNKKFDRLAIHSHTSFMSGVLMLKSVAILPSKHFKELKITQMEPEQVHTYYKYSDTLEHNYRWGCIYNDEFCYSLGIPYLEKVYKADPHYPGVRLNMDRYDYISSQGIEMKLASAYYRSEQYDKAIAVLNSALLYNSNNLSFYMQLGMSHDRKKEWAMAIEIYKRGLALITVEKSRYKSWFAGCISNMYAELNNESESKSWRAKSVEYDPHPGLVP